MRGVDAVNPAGKADLSREKWGETVQSVVSGQHAQSPLSSDSMRRESPPSSDSMHRAHCPRITVSRSEPGSSDADPGSLGALLFRKPTAVLAV